MQVICEKVSVKESWKDIMTMDGLQGIDINKSVAMSIKFQILSINISTISRWKYASRVKFVCVECCDNYSPLYFRTCVVERRRPGGRYWHWPGAGLISPRPSIAKLQSALWLSCALCTCPVSCRDMSRYSSQTFYSGTGRLSITKHFLWYIKISTQRLALNKKVQSHSLLDTVFQETLQKDYSWNIVSCRIYNLCIYCYFSYKLKERVIPHHAGR